MFNRYLLPALCAAVFLIAPAAYAEEAAAPVEEAAAAIEPVRPDLQPMAIPDSQDPPKTEKRFIQPDDAPGAAIPHLTTNDFLRVVGGAEKPVLVQFDATWCPFCKKMQPYLDKLRTSKLDTIDVYKVDADDDADLMRSYEVGTLPTLIMFYDGRIVGRSDGGLDESELKDWVSAVEDDIKAVQKPSKRGRL